VAALSERRYALFHCRGGQGLPRQGLAEGAIPAPSAVFVFLLAVWKAEPSRLRGGDCSAMAEPCPYLIPPCRMAVGLKEILRIADYLTGTNYIG
jgi:hypothetical protein